MWKVFEDLDLNGDGKLDKEEIGKALGADLSKEEVSKIFDKVDQDKSGKVDYAEFIDAWYNIKVSSEPPQQSQQPETKVKADEVPTTSAGELGEAAAAASSEPNTVRATREIDEEKNGANTNENGKVCSWYCCSAE
uniref:EF-hand domain-containing protein n=1 Tax=Lotharella globosa TaxID=91324 RepID=A0A7S4DHE6_9EUKA|mmetsp:Transcript_6090/g.12070  ORF Transcript_6090/g.12070 Transcript_6090/m.12070 type:complete len:136 (+) Transcript_6090:36-443(+)